jgi:hypothetical protein
MNNSFDAQEDCRRLEDDVVVIELNDMVNNACLLVHAFSKSQKR